MLYKLSWRDLISHLQLLFVPYHHSVLVHMQVDYIVEKGWTPCLEFAEADDAYVKNVNNSRFGPVSSGYYDNRRAAALYLDDALPFALSQATTYVINTTECFWNRTWQCSKCKCKPPSPISGTGPCTSCPCSAARTRARCSGRSSRAQSPSPMPTSAWSRSITSSRSSPSPSWSTARPRPPTTRTSLPAPSNRAAHLPSSLPVGLPANRAGAWRAWLQIDGRPVACVAVWDDLGLRRASECYLVGTG